MAATARPVTVPTPSRVEAAALAEAARYLRRAGTRTATLLLLADSGRDHDAILGMVRDELLSCASLCESLLETVPHLPIAGR